ncbi:MAG: flavodoxin [Succinimonas sp.]|jgi:flavodoxin|nr:flavodoxin [Succinimonas sp.]
MNTLRKILAAGLLSGLSLGGSAALAAETDTLVVYFSATGRTEVAAEAIAAELKADTFALNPAVPYSVKDLDYRDPESRSSKEHQDPSIKPEYTGDVADWNKYGTVYIGYPIWWGEAPNIVYTFAEKHDFSGKTVITFSTSGSSGHGQSSEHLAAKAGAGSWKPGKGFSSSVNTAEVKKWARESR